jgi:hypothetical protein
MMAVRYGTIRENILALVCDLPDADATVVRVGIHAWKSSARYDLVSLMCGSEGTYLGCHYVGDSQTTSHSRACGGDRLRL